MVCRLGGVLELSISVRVLLLPKLTTGLILGVSFWTAISEEEVEDVARRIPVYWERRMYRNWPVTSEGRKADEGWMLIAA